MTTYTREQLIKQCGVCNHVVPIDHAQLGRLEEDGTHTAYHMGCEFEASKVGKCEDCGHHRRLCNDCAEPEWEQSGGTGE